MNLRLFLSWHALPAAAIAGGSLLWWRLGGFAAGSREGSDVAFLLWTGWAALALYIIVVLYAARKYVHKLGLSPEFRAELPLARLEKAQSRLSEIRVRIAAGQLREAGRIEDEARRVLREEGVARVLRARARRTGGRQGTLELVVETTDPLGRMSTWLQAHLYYGVAAGLLVFLHGGGAIRSPLAFVLTGLSAVVIATGLFGIVLWVFGPSWLTRRERDVSIEKAFALRDHYQRRCGEAGAAFDTALEPHRSALSPDLERRLRRVRSGRRRIAPEARALVEVWPREGGLGELRPKLLDLLVLLGQQGRLEKEWRALSRIRFVLNVWRAVHVPASIILMAAVVLHVAAVWWY